MRDAASWMGLRAPRTGTGCKLDQYKLTTCTLQAMLDVSFALCTGASKSTSVCSYVCNPPLVHCNSLDTFGGACPAAVPMM